MVGNTHHYAVFIALSACAGTAEDSGESGDPALDSGESGDSFSLSDGVWPGTYSLQENECGAEAHTGDLVLTISSVEENVFTLTTNDLDYSCTLEGWSASCDPLVVDETVGDGFSILSTVFMGFTLESATSMTGLSNLEYSCEGKGCEEFLENAEKGQSLPCVRDIPFTATLED